MQPHFEELRFDETRTEAEYIEFADADDIWIRFYSLPKKGLAAPQHSHTHDHLTLLCRGSVLVYKEEVLFGVFVAPAVITIAAGSKHMFISQTDDVLLACVHNLRGREVPEIAEYYELTEKD
jgi:hypothetical protein